MTERDPANLTVPHAGREYIERLTAHGVLEGEPGGHTMSEELQTAMHAVHVIVAGGSASITIQDLGAGAVVEELDELLQAVLEELNSYPPGFEVYF